MPLLARRAASATERTLVYFRMNMYIRPPMRLSSSPTRGRQVIALLAKFGIPSHPAPNQFPPLRRGHDRPDVLRREELRWRDSPSIHLREAIHGLLIAVDRAKQLLHLGRRRLQRR